MTGTATNPVPLSVPFRGTIVFLDGTRMAAGIATGHPLEWARHVLAPDDFAAHIAEDPDAAVELAESAMRVFNIATNVIAPAPAALRQPAR